MKLTGIILVSVIGILPGCLKAKKGRDAEAPSTAVVPGTQTGTGGSTGSGSTGPIGGNQSGSGSATGISPVPTSLQLSLNLIEPGVTTTNQKVYVDVEPIFRKNCTTCHGESGDASLNLKSFPFSNSRDSLEQITRTIRARMNHATRPMPPTGLLTLSDRMLVNSWIDSGAPLTFPTSGTTQSLMNYRASIQYTNDLGVSSAWMDLPAFVGTTSNLALGSMKVDSVVSIAVKVRGPSGAEILNKTFPLAVPATGKLIVPLQATAEDVQAPQTAGLNVKDVTNTAAKLTWDEATDNVTAPGDLRYSLYYRLGTDTETPTVADIIASGTQLINSTRNVKEFAATGLKNESTYFYALVVKDSRDNQAEYPVLKFKTKPDPVTFVQANVQVNLNLVQPGTSAASPVVYVDVEPIFRKNCTSCHGVAGDASLNLKTFPFANGRGDTLSQITQNIRARMNHATQPMPASGLLPLAERMKVNSWIDSGAPLTFPTSGPTQSLMNYRASIQYTNDLGVSSAWMDLPTFVGTTSNLALGSMKVDSVVSVAVKVRGPSGAEILNKTFPLAVPATGKLIVPLQATAEDEQAPQTGGLNVTDVTNTAANLIWDYAKDNVTATEELLYSLSYRMGTDSETPTVAGIIATGTALITAQKNIKEFKAADLEQNSVYYYALVVQDKQGNKGEYPLLKFKTKANPVTPDVDEDTSAQYPNCGPMTEQGLLTWRDAAAAAAEVAEDNNNQTAMKFIAGRIAACFPEKVPSCLERTNDFVRKDDVARSDTLDITTEAKKLPDDFKASGFSASAPKYVIPKNIETIAESKGWTAVRYKSRHAGGFDAGSSNLLMIYVPGKTFNPPLAYDRWINIAFTPDNGIASLLDPMPAKTDELNVINERTFTMVSLDRATNDKPAVVYFQMFTRDFGDIFKPGSPFMGRGLKFCAECHPNGLRAISPLGFHVREEQSTTSSSDLANYELSNTSMIDMRTAISNLPSKEAMLSKEDWKKVKLMNDAMDAGTLGKPVSWGEGKVGSQVKPLFIPNGYGPIVGPLKPHNTKNTRSKEYLKTCYKKRNPVIVKDVFGRPAGMGPNNFLTLSPNAETNIDWDKVSQKMACESCHNGVKRGTLNTNTDLTQIDFKILVDQSMPEGEHLNPFDQVENLDSDDFELKPVVDNFNNDERIALANCLLEEFNLEEKLVGAWMREVKQCTP